MTRRPGSGPPAGRPLVLGHRGASAEAPENTLCAFVRALALGADGVELDVWRCATGEVVVHHDLDTSRTCGARLRVPSSSLSALRRLDAGTWKGAQFAGERIPTLREVFEAVPGAVVNVELKAARLPDLALAGAVASAIDDAGAAGRVLVSSFDLALLAAFRLAAPRVPAGVLFDVGPAWRGTALAGRWMGASAVHPARYLATPERVARWISSGLRVNVWTVDAAEEVRRLAAAGVTGIITNRPDLARAELVRVAAAAPSG